MVTKKRTRGGTSKLTRSEVVTVRLPPRLRYGVELAARRQRRTTSGFIEWVIQAALQNEWMSSPYLGKSRKMTVSAWLVELWDADVAERFVKLAVFFPELLNHEEEILWKVIREHYSVIDKFATARVERPNIRRTYRHLSEHWELFNKVATELAKGKGMKALESLPPLTTK